MPTKLSDLLERENQAGNQEDGQFSGASGRQKNQDFDDIARNSEQEDFDDIINNSFSPDERMRLNSDGVMVPKNDNADDNNENINDARAQEKESLFKGGGNPGISKFTGGRLKGFVKNKGPGIGVIGLIIGGFAGLSGVLVPGALLVMLEKGVTNFSMEDTRTNIIMRRAYIGGIFSKSTADTDLKKRMLKMGEAQKLEWEKKGFKIDAEPDGKFFKVNSMTFPDGKVVTTAAEFHQHTDSNILARQASDRVFNIRSGFKLQNPKFEKVMDKFKLKRGNIIESSNDKDKAKRTEEINKSFDEKAETAADKEARLSRVKTSFDTEKSKFGSKFAKKVGFNAIGAANVAATACMAYNTARATNATVKAYWIYQLVKFAYPFIQAASQIEDQGNIEPEVVENISDRLTWYVSPSYAQKLVESGEDPNAQQKVNLTAMDSQGLKAALYGDYEKLADFTKTYTTGMTSIAMGSNAVVKYAEGHLGKQNIHDACKTAGAISLLGSVTCITSPISAAVCVGALAALAAFGDDIIKAIADEMAEPAMEAIAEANLSSDLKGVDAGNALAAGVGLFLTQGNFGSGNRPGTNVDQVKKFSQATDELNYKYTEELAIEEAKQNPFDMYNKYSFAGKLAIAVNPYRQDTTVGYDILANATATLFSPLTLLSQSASAMYHQPSQLTEREGTAQGMIGNCTDPDMIEANFVCDWSGRPLTYITPEVITEMTDTANNSTDGTSRAIDFMTSNGYVDAEGKAVGDNDQNGPEGDDEEDDEIYNYIKYKNYCTNDRIDPPATSSQPIEQGTQDDQRWYTMERCAGDPANQAEQTMLNNFFIYYNMCETQSSSANMVSNCWTDEVAAAPSTPSGGDWVIPTSGPCLSPYGQRWGTLHAGIDISPPSGTPIVAPTDMTITFAGFNNGGYGNMVTGTATDGSQNSFRFGHMVGQPNVSQGQNVKKGQVLGAVGNTGDSQGPHLHFEIFPPGGDPATYSGAVDPVPVLKDHGVSIAC